MALPKFRKNYVQFQVLGMMRHWNQSFKVVRMRNESAQWNGKIHPTPMSESYEVSISYKVGESPSVSVRSPILIDRSPTEKIPHTYPGNRLCLFLPRANEWSRDDLIAETIVPWSALWLYHYEVWHITGEWLGGGVHPSRPEEKREKEG